MSKTINVCGYGKATVITKDFHAFPVLRFVGQSNGYNIYVYDCDVKEPSYYALKYGDD